MVLKLQDKTAGKTKQYGGAKRSDTATSSFSSEGLDSEGKKRRNSEAKDDERGAVNSLPLRRGGVISKGE